MTPSSPWLPGPIHPRGASTSTRQRSPRVTVPFLDTLRSLSDQLAGDEITLGLVDVSPQVLEVLRRSEWFFDAERSGLVEVQVDAASLAPDEEP